MSQSIKEQTLATINKIVTPAVIGLLSNNPEIASLLILAHGFYGVSMEYKQNDINEIVQFIVDNPGKFTDGMMKTQEFQDGFVVFLENYLKSRGKKKKAILREILLNFSDIPQEKKEIFPLERIQSIVNHISYDAIKLLGMYEISKAHILSKGRGGAAKKALLSYIRELGDKNAQNEIYQELVYLNIFWQTSDVVFLTKFGEEFIRYINKDEK